MEWSEIKENLSKMAALSVAVQNARRSNDALFDYIDALPQQVKETLYARYINSDGPVLSIRKQVVEAFNAPVDRGGIVSTFESGKKGKPKTFTLYKDLYAILYPFFTDDTNDQVYDTLDNLAHQLRTDLQLDEQTDIVCFGFDGARNTGSDHAWFAIYNNTHPNQQNAKQLFFSIHDGQISYSLYDRVKNKRVGEITEDVSALDYDTLLNWYTKYKQSILLDDYRAAALAVHPLEKLLADLGSNKIKAWEVKPGEKAKLWKDALREGNIRMGWDEIMRDLFEENNFDEEFIRRKLSQHRPKDGDNQNNNKISIRSFLTDMSPDDLVFAVSGRAEIVGVGVITSQAEFDEDKKEYKALRKVDWIVDLSKKPYRPDKPMAVKTLTKLDSSLAINTLKNIFNYSTSFNTGNMEFPFINTILYGPPGTGKTYKLNQIKQNLFTDTNVAKTPAELLAEKMESYTYWMILTAILANAGNYMSVGELLDHPLIKAKLNPDVTASRQVLWGVLQAYADDASTKMDPQSRRAIPLFRKDKDSKWAIIEDRRTALPDILGPELIELARHPLMVAPTERTSKTRYSFITFHQKYSYEDFIEGIRPVLKKETKEPGTSDLQFELKRGIFYNSCLAALQLAGYSSFQECYTAGHDNREKRFNEIKNDKSKQYGVLIDEINRANISAVFGELITLLEDKKRMGGEEELWISLPYSGESFGVPPNLYVIGTMNTADRSIALVDIALRRRFEFEGLYPQYTEGVWWAPLLESINQALYDRKKGPDFFIGHAFFMNKPESEKTTILNKKIIPLLYEYCQNNGEVVRHILKAADVEIGQSDIKNNFQIIAK